MKENISNKAGTRNPYHGFSSVYDLEYHIVWVTKYRNIVFNEAERKYLHYLIMEIVKENESKAEALTIMPNHVHLLLLMTPKVSLSVMMMKLKGTTARKMFIQFPELKKSLYGGHLWSHSYYASTVGNVNESIVKKYIETQWERPFK